jgi:hypothetical protein
VAKRISERVLGRERARFDGVEAITLGGWKRARFRVDADGGRFDCVLSRGSGRLFVLLSGGVDRAQGAELPRFQRWKWARSFPGHVLLVSDPTLYLADEIGLGWYVGPAASNWHRTLARLVSRVAAELGVGPDRIVYYGSSSGGFAAIATACWSRAAGAIAINPQTDVLRYQPVPVQRMLDACFPGTSPESFPDDAHRERLLAAGICARSSGTRILIAQNVRDHVHFELHFAPFCDRFGIPTNGGLAPDGTKASLLFENEQGHIAAEPRELLPQLLARYDALSPAPDPS